MVRTADAVGADAVIAAGAGTDWTNPNVIRASQGAVFGVPTASADGAAVVDFLHERGVALMSLIPGAAREIWDEDLAGPVALAVGAEDQGLSPTLAAAGKAVALPVAGLTDSLNAAAAAAVALYEVVRQRR